MSFDRFQSRPRSLEPAAVLALADIVSRVCGRVCCGAGVLAELLNAHLESLDVRYRFSTRQSRKFMQSQEIQGRVRQGVARNSDSDTPRTVPTEDRLHTWWRSLPLLPSRSHLTKPPSQDRLDGRVCPRNGLSPEKRTPSVRGVCWERVKTTQEAPSRAARSWSWVWSSTWPRCVLTSESTWPRFCFCCFLGLDEHAADDEQARPQAKLHEQARPSEELDATVVQKHRPKTRAHPNLDREKNRTCAPWIASGFFLFDDPGCGISRFQC